MSVTVAATPILLFSSLQVLQSIIAASAGLGAMALTNSAIDSLHTEDTTNPKFVHLETEELEKLLQKEFTTNIMDKETLIKTLEEHGAVDIKEKDDNITCKCEVFALNFVKQDNDKPYTMTAYFNDEFGLDEFVKDIGAEYAMNAQEVSYNKIKERLERQNLKINNEEIYDDNTIVLTVDLN